MRQRRQTTEGVRAGQLHRLPQSERAARRRDQHLASAKVDAQSHQVNKATTKDTNLTIGQICVLVRLTGNSHEDITVPLSFRPRRLFLCAYEDVLANIDGR